MKKLKTIYLENKEIINERLHEFNIIWPNGSDEKLFEELCYCICTPREKAKNALTAISRLKELNILLQGSEKAVMKTLKNSGIALYPRKASNIINARKKYFPDTKKKLIAEYFYSNDILETRIRISENISGIGLKEASHFLRNIGLGGSICILDTHILNQLLDYGLIKSKPKSLTKNKYLEIEKTMIKFAQQENIPIDALDLVFMLTENAEIVK
jgi:N-glycosylase/DNA lyase